MNFISLIYNIKPCFYPHVSCTNKKVLVTWNSLTQRPAECKITNVFFQVEI